MKSPRITTILPPNYKLRLTLVIMGFFFRMDSGGINLQARMEKGFEENPF
jgi:hypothetical protein